MKWTHILDAQPMVGRTIVMFSRDFTPRDLRRYRLYQRNYIDHRSIKNVAWEEFIKDSECKPNYWWMYAEDFQIPGERRNEFKDRTVAIAKELRRDLHELLSEISETGARVQDGLINLKKMIEEEEGERSNEL